MLTDSAHRAGMAALGAAEPEGFPAAVRRLDLAVLHGIAAFLGEELEGKGPLAAAEIAAVLGAAPRHAWIVEHWLDALTGEGLAERSGAGRHDGFRRRRRSELIALRRDLDGARRALGYSERLTRYLLDSLRALPDLLADRASAQAMLFPEGDLGTAAAIYRDNPVNRYLNAAAVDAVCALPAKRRVLELGAGTGSLTADLLPILAGHTAEYLFTDLSPFFLEAARRRFGDVPFLRTALVDFGADFGADLAGRCGPEPFDLVVAVNAAHNAPHLGELLGRVRAVLAPGGAVLLIETCHEHHQSLLSMPFLLSAPPGEARTERRDRRAGTRRTYLTREEWTAELGAAGLPPVLELPRPDHPLAAFSQHLLIAAPDLRGRAR
ncbi:class I SAM-dependent methyltransferase [Actinomadura sp. WMMB 499]|uniref:class I SAM-dependent methyltransferase n=1 Tax=Actinomadura sp. WMMB 499 TaxID=1219491 RepID=UPI001247CAD5|nr:class I SAM-dependent methyltransferase [Actinomadura sp. WMMB 499]QFG22431.1 methyltransferase [Actinomadura sp. WMMB 499]